jgi:hypothetical protein
MMKINNKKYLKSILEIGIVSIGTLENCFTEKGTLETIQLYFWASRIPPNQGTVAP